MAVHGQEDIKDIVENMREKAGGDIVFFEGEARKEVDPNEVVRRITDFIDIVKAEGWEIDGVDICVQDELPCVLD